MYIMNNCEDLKISHLIHRINELTGELSNPISPHSSNRLITIKNTFTGIYLIELLTVTGFLF